MGTTLANVHILGGELEQIQALLPEATVGRWSDNCVSAFSPRFLPGAVDKEAQALSKKLAATVLSAWLFDSDAIGLTLFQSGRKVAAHILDPEGYSQLGNIPLFCQTWGLPEEDVPRLRTVWRKGSAEEQLELTAALMGLPLYHDSQELPDKTVKRDAGAVDRWIAERPAPPRIKNQAKAELIQELPEFRYGGPHNSDAPFYLSVDPCDDPYAYDRYHLWQSQADGAIREIWATEHLLSRSFSTPDRLVYMELYSGTVLFDSAGLLSSDFPTGDYLWLLEDGGALRETFPSDSAFTLARLTADGKPLWRRDGATGRERLFAASERELLWMEDGPESRTLVRVDMATGQELGRLDSPLGLNVYQKVWHSGAWWATHDGILWKNGAEVRKGYLLTKLDVDLNVLAEVPLPTFTQEIFFSSDDTLVYVFFYEGGILAFDADRLTAVGQLTDKAFLSPLGFDGGRFWLQRENSTVEAWDPRLTKPISRHRLKGEIVRQHRDGEGHLCVSTWDEKRCIFRVYRLI